MLEQILNKLLKAPYKSPREERLLKLIEPEEWDWIIANNQELINYVIRTYNKFLNEKEMIISEISKAEWCIDITAIIANENPRALKPHLKELGIGYCNPLLGFEEKYCKIIKQVIKCQ